MATREELIEALRAADAAGDRPAAETLAAALQRMTVSPPSPSEPLMEGAGGDGAISPDVARQKSVIDEYEAQPWYSQAGTALDDMLRLGSNGITFGFRDKLAQFAGGGTPEEERAKTADASIRAGFPGDLAEAGGMMAFPGLGLEKAATKVITPATSAIQKLLTYGSGAAGEGAIVGGLDAAGHDQNIAEGAKRGMVFGPLARLGVEAIAKGGRAAAGVFNPAPVIPSAADLTSRADADYSRMRKERINVKSGRTAPLKNKIIQDMRRFELDDVVHPKAARRTKVLDEKLSRPTGISLSRLDAQRGAINRDIPGETAGGQTAGILTGNIDDFINRMDSTMTTGGRDPGNAIDAMLSGRRNVQKSENMREIEEAMAAAEGRGARSKSSDYDAAIASEFAKIENRGDRGWVPEAFDKIREVATPRGARKAAQQLGRLSPTNWSGMGGVGIGGGLSLGYAGGGLTGAALLGTAIPAAGYAGKKAADHMSRMAAEEAAATVAAGGRVKPYTNAIQDAIDMTKKKGGRLAQMLAIANSSGQQ